MDQVDELLSRRQVAAALGVHPDTVRRWQRVGDMPIVRIGGQVRVLRSDLDAYIEGRRETCGRDPLMRNPAGGPGSAGTPVGAGRDGEA